MSTTNREVVRFCCVRFPAEAADDYMQSQTVGTDYRSVVVPRGAEHHSDLRSLDYDVKPYDLLRLERGHDLTTRRAARVVQKLSTHWPEGLDWPSDIPRPAPERDAA